MTDALGEAGLEILEDFNQVLKETNEELRTKNRKSLSDLIASKL